MLTVALDVTITDELRREGIARELVSKIQNIRKSSGFEITDRIAVTLSSNENSDAAIEEHKAYICNQVLADSLIIEEPYEGIVLDFDGFSLAAIVEKI